MSEEQKSDNVFRPRPGSAEYKFLLGDEEEQKRIIKEFQRINKYFTIPLYRIGLLPLFGFGFLFLLLYTKGRKTGKVRITPLEYHKIDGVIHIFAGRGEKAHWLRNMKSHPEDIKIRIGFRKYPVRFEILPIEERKKVFHWYVIKHPKAAKGLMGWDPKRDDPNKTDFSFLAEKIVVIRLYKKE
ncbi:MAG: nitroreductase/quinone reductase family protein [Candidatus Heimdallarchaeaceae archaeon]